MAATGQIGQKTLHAPTVAKLPGMGPEGFKLLPGHRGKGDDVFGEEGGLRCDIIPGQGFYDLQDLHRS
ncbi:MAG: hypothetical protein ACPGOY_18990, partial [Rhodospirillaceae bacterium]